MKLATLKDSTRDGKLVVVSKDLTRCSEVGHIARTLQAALDDWAHVAPRLERVALGLETGSQPTIRFHEHDAASPLPRAFFWAGGSGGFSGPRDSIRLAAGASDIVVTTQLAVIVDDIDAADGKDAASRKAALFLLSSDISVGGSNAGSSFSPVAVTVDELGDEGHLAVLVRRNGKSQQCGTVSAKDAMSGVGAVVAGRPLIAGSIVASGSSRVSCDLAVGDTVRIEMKDHTGHSIFGAIEQTVETRD
ncbi:MAG TPA: fumarylacetoacetate hydrolase family protein [Pararhizobium sp.]|uniref:fumarylacetoacetate hydrolase family protein n=1 Tax=Pararhizobium sp. TaxID=1977563 RepID=UPI002C61008E|nr:fumarylacetoacetate hydrolase family protein [Pararhizobium sp.]HTO31857.1 fumarylacetoacetate hydrolase family protein [Pararhizobium sp.]